MTALAKARKLPRFALTRSGRALNRAADLLETSLGDGGDAPLPQVPILILGPPRSGSTLLHQLLVRRFRVGYLSNLHCRLYGGPSLVERALRGRGAPPGDFTSTHGRTEGRLAPSECGEFWYRFFRRSPQYVPLEEADPGSLRRLRAAVRELARAAGRPLVFKNLLCSLRVRPIATALPEALFLVVRRDEADNARSLLAARRRVHGDEATWWSAQPPDWEELQRLPPQDQVVGQIRAIEALVERDRAELGDDRFLDIRYEALCEDPRTELAGVASFAERHGARLEARAEVPENFSRGGG